MSKFKEGDRVRVIRVDEDDLEFGLEVGSVGVCVDSSGMVEFVGRCRYMLPDQLEFAENIEEDTVDNLVKQLNKLGYKVILSKE